MGNWWRISVEKFGVNKSMVKNSGCRISVGNFWHGKFKLTPQDVHLVKKEEDENIKKVDVENV